MQNIENKQFMPSINNDQLFGGQEVQENSPMIQLGGLISITYLAGTLDKEEEMRFKKIVYRASRGKALTYFKDVS